VVDFKKPCSGSSESNIFAKIDLPFSYLILDLISGCLLEHFWASFGSLGARLRRLGPTFGALWASHEPSHGHLEPILVTILVSLVSFGRLFGLIDVLCLTKAVPNNISYI
jgi:hypothetical protein